MEVKASLKHLRMSPTKVRLVADLIRGMEASKALDQMQFSAKWASKPLAKLVKSAIANAVNNFDLDKDNLKVSEIRVDAGLTLKRSMPRAHGRATAIRKRGCHVDLVLAEIKDSGKKEAKKAKIEAPVKMEDLTKVKQEPVVKTKVSKEAKVDDEEKGTEASNAHDAHGGHAKIEGKGHNKGFSSRVFRRKSG